jgi:hypothetical protein
LYKSLYLRNLSFYFYFLSLCFPVVGEAEIDNGEVLRGTLALPGADTDPTLAFGPRLEAVSGAEAGSFSFAELGGEIIKLLLLNFFSAAILFELFLRLNIKVSDFLDEMRCIGAGPRGLVSPVRLTISVVICASSNDTKPSLNHD